VCVTDGLAIASFSWTGKIKQNKHAKNEIGRRRWNDDKKKFRQESHNISDWLIFIGIFLFLFLCWCRTGGTNCIRCFELTLRSLNVVQIHTEGLDKCYTTEEAAMATCPTDESIATGKSREIMLYSEFFLKPSPLLFFFLIFLAFLFGCIIYCSP
jgi:hypothetical protein